MWMPLRPRFALNVGLVVMLVSPRLQANVLPDQRLQIPNSSKQTPVYNAIRSEFKTEYANRDVAAQLALSHKFTGLALQSDEDPVRQYVLLREAKELAINGGDLDAAFSIIDQTAQQFAVDANELKVTAMAAAMDRARVPPVQLMSEYLKIAESSLDDGDLRMASQAMTLANRIARSSRDRAALARARQTDLRLHDASRQLAPIMAAFNRLKLKPEDPEANLVVGRYLCFMRGVWDEGLPLLAKGSDKALAELAQEDLSQPSDAPSQFKLGGEYWELSQKSGLSVKRRRQRASYWYQKASPQLQGEQKQTAQQRIAEASPKP